MKFLGTIIFSIGLVFCAQSSLANSNEALPVPISTTVETEISASKEAVFNFTVAEDVLPKVLWDHGIIPGVSRTDVLNIPSWDRPGANRIVYLNDGNTAHEEITDFDRSDYFAYRVSQFTGLTGRLALEAHGQWWFEERDGKTYVKWTYSFFPKSACSSFILKHIVVPEFNGYMQDAIARIKADVEKESPEINHDQH